MMPNNPYTKISVDRRRFLESSGAGFSSLGPRAALGLPLSQLHAAPRSKTSTFGRAKSLVILYLYGAPSQMDTLDPKPDAPIERRGEFKTIPTSLPGIAVCEHLLNVAKNLHRVALICSMTHTSNNHAVSVALSGLSKSLPAIECNNNDPTHQLHIGSVLEYLWKQRGISMLSTGVPVNMVLPWALNDRTGLGRWTGELIA